MTHDFDDTVPAGERIDVKPTEPDLDDTILCAPRRRQVEVQPSRGAAAGRSQPSGTPPTRVPTGAASPSVPKSGASPQQPVTRPTQYYRVQLDGASGSHDLERPCVFGREPRPPRIVRGVPPTLISVASPTREVSETHVEIRQLGSSVVVTDLRSTNGSTVHMPGNTAQKLRQGESVVVTAGTLVDIGDGNVIRILPRRHLE